MITIGVFNQKGGTAKTTSVYNIAGIMAKKYKKKVLVIDADKQCHITRRLLYNNIEECNGEAEYFEGKLSLENLFECPKLVNAAIHKASIKSRTYFEGKNRGIDVLPLRPQGVFTTTSFDDVEKMLINTEDENVRYNYMRHILSLIKRTVQRPYDYDICLIDMSPNLTEFSKVVLAACDYILVPASCDDDALSGFKDLLSTIDFLKAKGINPNIELMGIYMTIVDSQAISDKSICSSVKESFGPTYMNTPIRRSVDVKESNNFYKIPLAWMKRNGKATNDYDLLCREIMRRLGWLSSEEEIRLTGEEDANTKRFYL